MSKKTLSFVLIISSWSLAFFGFIAWLQQAPIGDFWHIDDVSMYIAFGNACFLTLLCMFDESFGFRE